MEIVVCLDENNGMMFNHRRQSRDRVVIDDILAQAQGRPLWMNDYSAPLFEGVGNVHVSPHFLSEAPENAVCFVEDQVVAPIVKRVARVVVYRWHRVYPADQYFDLTLTDAQWRCVERVDLSGHSHDIITREVYER